MIKNNPQYICDKCKRDNKSSNDFFEISIREVEPIKDIITVPHYDCFNFIQSDGISIYDKGHGGYHLCLKCFDKLKLFLRK